MLACGSQSQPELTPTFCSSIAGMSQQLDLAPTPVFPISFSQEQLSLSPCRGLIQDTENPCRSPNPQMLRSPVQSSLVFV